MGKRYVHKIMQYNNQRMKESYSELFAYNWNQRSMIIGSFSTGFVSFILMKFSEDLNHEYHDYW